jgi:aarF domain-containing kinase
MAAAFGRPADEVFSYISPRPVAAASLGQVYRAQLRPQYGSGEVAIKVQRPGVLEQVRQDLDQHTPVCISMASPCSVPHLCG